VGSVFLWNYITSCARGQLPSGECSPVFQFAAIIVFLVIAVCVLARLMLRRTRAD
jgi:hypothetical protein